MKRTDLGIIAISLVCCLVVMLAERTVGIGWDYHPDSVYYMQNSVSVTENLRAGGLVGYLNNGYYVLCWLLGPSLTAITTLSALLFAFTNVVMYRAHVRYAGASTGVGAYAIWLLLLNPYRLHLSTTVLKDSLLIFLAVLAAASAMRYVKLFTALAFFRLAGVLYGAHHFRGRYLGAGIVVVAGAVLLFPAATAELILSSNESEMVFREFDRVPTFQEFGLSGALLRAVLWPVLAISGGFFALSPSVAYFPVAVGSLFTLLYCSLVFKRVRVPLGIVGALFLFGVLVTGFTSYIRYVYPLLTVWPLALLYRASQVTAEAGIAPDVRVAGLLTRLVRVFQRAQANRAGV